MDIDKNTFRAVTVPYPHIALCAMHTPAGAWAGSLYLQLRRFYCDCETAMAYSLLRLTHLSLAIFMVDSVLSRHVIIHSKQLVNLTLRLKAVAPSQ